MTWSAERALSGRNRAAARRKGLARTGHRQRSRRSYCSRHERRNAASPSSREPLRRRHAAASRRSAAAPTARGAAPPPGQPPGPPPGSARAGTAPAPPPPPPATGAGGYDAVEAIKYGWTKFTKNVGPFLIGALIVAGHRHRVQPPRAVHRRSDLRHDAGDHRRPDDWCGAGRERWTLHRPPRQQRGLLRRPGDHHHRCRRTSEDGLRRRRRPGGLPGQDVRGLGQGAGGGRDDPGRRSPRSSASSCASSPASRSSSSRRSPPLSSWTGSWEPSMPSRRASTS